MCNTCRKSRVQETDGRFSGERKGLLSRQREYGIMREAKRGWEGDCLSPVSAQGAKLHDTDGL